MRLNISMLTNFINKCRQFTIKEKYYPYLFDSLIIVVILFLFIYPLFYCIVKSFFINDKFILSNYIRMASDDIFLHSIVITFLYVLFYTFGIMLIGFITALVVDKSEQLKLPGAKVFTAFVTLPYAIPDVVASLIWLWMLNPRRGVINYLLSHLVGKSEIGWLTNSDIALVSVLLVSIWRLFPMHTLIILAAFRTVPMSLYEAASIDGASFFKQFFYITLPSISNIMKFLLLLTIVWSFKRFTIIWFLTRGGPMHATETLSIMIFKEAFKFFNRNYASSISVILLVIVGTVSIFLLRYLRVQDGKEGV
ncbi:sugar ABC transporter permease [Candidatus Atribacteria bacterium 1244-E10-H5-B2]|nr:MAG: sugar ABC transporter permease [Candidatus Atribacteria bacterium 1244-E10-H5-B2]